jgi:3-methyl-2-oxobutanoate hydroxymethyltransferase
MKAEELKKLKGVRKVTMLTAYDAQTARILDNVGVDVILVGDSLGMVVLGYEDTKRVTMDVMISHTEAVARGTENAHIIGDMPINSFDTVEDALLNAHRFANAGAHSVKIEGYHPEVIKAIISDGIPVIGHVGLLPQTAKKMKVKGKKKSEAELIMEDAKALDELGVYAMVLECIPLNLAKEITEAVNALTIGIGAGMHCDGQVLVINDMLGMESGYTPKHAKVYANLNEIITIAVAQYIEDVKSGKFPTDKFSFH